MTVGMIFGDYNFADNGPIPVFSYSRSIEKTAGFDGVTLARPITFTLNGTLTDPDGIGGFDTTMSQITGGLSHYFQDGDCKLFQITGCESSNLVVNTSGKVVSLNISPRNEGDPFVKTADYTIVLEVPSLTGSLYDGQDIDSQGVSALEESWSIEFLDQRDGATFTGINGNANFNLQQAFSISHEVSVDVNPSCTPTESTAIDMAKNYIANNYNSISSYDYAEATGLFDIGMYLYQRDAYDHWRTITQNKNAGKVSMNESWVFSADEYPAIEDFEVTIETSEETDYDTINVNGSVRGLADIRYTGVASNTAIPVQTNSSKIQNAFNKFSNSSSGLVYTRANQFYQQHGNFLNIKPLSTSIGYNTVAGTINYNYKFDGRPDNLNPCAKSEKITITENEPNDVFAAIAILSRPLGPVLQNIGSSGVRTREISIEAILATPSGGDCTPVTGADGCIESFAGSEGCCDPYPSGAFSMPNSYDAIVDMYEQCNVNIYDAYYINSFNKTFDIKTGRFTLSKSYTVGNCLTQDQ